VFNAVGQESRAVGILFAIPVLIIFIIIAFFEISELTLIPFLAKLMKTYFFDATKKFQVNYEKLDKTAVAIKEASSNEKTQVITYKDNNEIDQKTLE
jgi:hypothetical protein